MVEGGPTGINISYGSWHHDRTHQLDEQMDVIRSAWESLYPTVELETSSIGQADIYSRAGLVLGLPSLKQHHGQTNGLPWDRIIRALHGLTWGALILSEPVHELVTHDLRATLLNESRGINAQARAELAPNPLASHYQELIEEKLNQLNQAHTGGGWRSAVYLLGDRLSYERLSALWIAGFAGDASRVEPLRTIESNRFGEWANDWQLPEAPTPPGPGHWQHPFQFQSLLSSAQLATYVHLPSRETAGFQIRELAPFDVVPPQPAGAAVQVGKVLQGNRETSLDYLLAESALNRHTFVSGLTGKWQDQHCLSYSEAVVAATATFPCIGASQDRVSGIAKRFRAKTLLAYLYVGTRKCWAIPFEPPSFLFRYSRFHPYRLAEVCIQCGVWVMDPIAPGIGTLPP